MLKRIMAILLCVAVLCGGTTVFAEDGADMTALETAAKVDDSLPAKSALLVELETGRVLYEKNADEVLAPASITKVMTLLLTMEAIETGKITLGDMVTCSERAQAAQGNGIWFQLGEQLSVDDLIKATTISSANDAAVALAEYIGGSEEAFVELMNARADELHMTNTHFVNATGLDADGHVTTARDIVAMSRALLCFPLITTYSSVWIAELRDGKTQLVNTNKLVRFYSGCTGLKTGTTSGAGSCLVASATKKGMSLIAVTLGSVTAADRFSASRGLLDFGYANYTRAELPPLAELKPIKVTGGVATSVGVVCEPPEAVVVKTGDKGAIKQEVTLPETVEAPIEAGQQLGTVAVHIAGVKLYEYKLVAAETVEEMTFDKAFMILLNHLIRM